MLRRRSGASGFVLKDTPPEHLLDAIRIIAAGDALLTRASRAVSSPSSLADHEPSRREHPAS